jgi:hypothetical protein
MFFMTFLLGLGRRIGLGLRARVSDSFEGAVPCETIFWMMSDTAAVVGFGSMARVLALLIVMGGCATPADGPIASSPAAPAALATGSPPEWRAGDRWVYGWTSGTEVGTKTVEVVEVRTVNQVTYYLVRIGDLIHFYTPELQWAGTMRDERVESRMTPPLPWFSWPLVKDRRWTYQGTYEQAGVPKQSVTDRFSVAESQPVEVPAGRFRAVKVVRETDRRDSDEYWYAPDVGFYVKWVGRRAEQRFEEQLREYHRAADMPRPATAPPSTNR